MGVDIIAHCVHVETHAAVCRVLSRNNSSEAEIARLFAKFEALVQTPKFRKRNGTEFADKHLELVRRVVDTSAADNTTLFDADWLGRKVHEIMGTVDYATLTGRDWPVSKLQLCPGDGGFFIDLDSLEVIRNAFSHKSEGVCNCRNEAPWTLLTPDDCSALIDPLTKLLITDNRHRGNCYYSEHVYSATASAFLKMVQHVAASEGYVIGIDSAY